MSRLQPHRAANWRALANSSCVVGFAMDAEGDHGPDERTRYGNFCGNSLSSHANALMRAVDRDNKRRFVRQVLYQLS